MWCRRLHLSSRGQLNIVTGATIRGRAPLHSLQMAINKVWFGRRKRVSSDGRQQIKILAPSMCFQSPLTNRDSGTLGRLPMAVNKSRSGGRLCDLKCPLSQFAISTTNHLSVKVCTSHRRQSASHRRQSNCQHLVSNWMLTKMRKKEKWFGSRFVNSKIWHTHMF